MADQPVPKPNAKVLTWLAIGLVVAGGVLEILHSLGTVTSAHWISVAAMVVGGAIAVAQKVQKVLNGEAVAEEAKARPASSDEEMEKRLGKP